MTQPIGVRPTNFPQCAFAPDCLVSLPGTSSLLQNTVTLAVTDASGRVAIKLDGAPQVELYNAGTKDCHVVFGDVTVTATVASYPVGAGQVKVVTIRPDLADKITNMAAICGTAADTTTLWASPGVGAS